MRITLAIKTVRAGHTRAKCSHETPVTRVPPWPPCHSPHKASAYRRFPHRLEPSRRTFRSLAVSRSRPRSRVSALNSQSPPPPPSPGLARTLLDRRLPSTYHILPSHLPPLPPTLSPAPSTPPCPRSSLPPIPCPLLNPKPPGASFRRSEAGRLGLSATASSSFRTAPLLLDWRGDPPGLVPPAADISQTDQWSY